MSLKSTVLIIAVTVLFVFIAAFAAGGTSAVSAEAEARVFLPTISRAFAPGITPYVSKLPAPARVTAVVDPGDGRLFVALKHGRILIVSADGQLQPEPLLDIHDLVQAFPYEAGLLGLALHPDFADNGRLYIYYTSGTQTKIATNIVRYTVGPNGLADPDSAELLLHFDQPALIHQGGDMHFGPQDGYLYIAVGDGGTPRDSAGNAQSTATILGKILRIDVDGAAPYAIPADNPFAGQEGKRGEIWAFGLRNPWRFSFDQLSGDMFIGDVGDGTWEEVNHIRASSPGGQNFGWPCYEGNSPFTPDSCDLTEGFTWPIYAYLHQQADYHCSITGGYVYRGERMPELAGGYLFADFCAGTLWSLQESSADTWQATSWGRVGQGWSTFGERSDGEIMIGAGETLYQLVPDGQPPTFPQQPSH